MSERWKFLYFTTKSTESFETSWSLCKEELKKGAAVATASTGSSGSAGSGGPADKKPLAVIAAGGKPPDKNQKRVKEGGAPSPADGKRARKDIDGQIAAVTKFKIIFHNCLGQVEAVMLEIQNNPKLDCLKGNTKILSPMLEAKGALQDALNTFRHSVLAATSPAGIKKLGDEATVARDLSLMVSECEPLLNSLASALKRVQGVKASMLE